ncbi:MAG TPA: molybdenum cofactor guanylyltransferase [Ktedonobacteraceae bacterium]
MINHRSTQTSGIILAGGSSSRMGKNKALLSLPGNKAVTFIEYLVSLLEEFCSETLIVARDQAHVRDYVFPGVRVTFDETPGIGPLMGVYSGLSAIHTTHALVVAVDLPCIQPALLSFLLSQRLPTDTLLVPLVHNIPQVLLAIYPRSVLPFVKEQLLQGRRDLRCLLNIAPVQYVEEAQLRQIDPQLRSFKNINTPEELRQVLQTGPAPL